MALLNFDVIRNELMRDAPWSGSHGADGDFLGLGLLYYAITYAMRARLAVCLGSGGAFVPRLMRQAQRDAGIADQSRTILVDANLAAAGWGAPNWVQPNSFFRQRFPDVDIRLATTIEAAENIFGPEELLIDYLHIDADHSFEAALADFRTYRAFLREGSVVTLHDTNFAGAGVKRVVDYLRSRNDCEVIDFPDHGAGTAIVRVIRPPPDRAPSPLKRLQVERRGSPSPLEPSSIGWAYLESAAFQSRSALAAYFVRDCRSVVEIGGGKTPLDRFVFGRVEEVLVVDPFLRDLARDAADGQPAVHHFQARIQDIALTWPDKAELGVVMLGFELLGLSDGDWHRIFELVNAARICVIEFPTSWDTSRHQFQRVRANTKLREIFQCRLDLAGNDVGDLTNSWPPRYDREFHVLAP